MPDTNLTVIITAKNEPETVKSLVSRLDDELAGRIQSEIFLVCPDKETADAGIRINGKVKWLKDKGKGKPAALNLAVGKAKGELLLLVDGDVLPKKGAVSHLLSCFAPDVGLVAGRPASINDKKTLFGFWSYLLTESAHRQRQNRFLKGEYFDASGYLLAVRKSLFPLLPEKILIDDGYISASVWEKGYKIIYQPKAEVFVRFPQNWLDWLKQKKRTVGGYFQKEYCRKIKKARMRSFAGEASGFWYLFSLLKSSREFFWFILLLFARIYLWLIVFWERKVVKKSFEKTWVRVESTKKPVSID